MSLVAMNVWMRPRSASRTASPATVTSRSFARERAATITPGTSSATARIASKSPGEEIGKPASMTSTPRRASCWAISTFSRVLSVDAGRLLAVAQGGVEDDDPLGGVLRCWGVLLVCGHGNDLLTNGLRGRSGPAHPGMGVGKLPLPGEEPTKRQEAARRQRGCVRDVQEHVRKDTRARRHRQTRRAARALTPPSPWRKRGVRRSIPSTPPPSRTLAAVAELARGLRRRARPL